MKRLIPVVACLLVVGVWYYAQRTAVQAGNSEHALNDGLSIKRQNHEPLPLAVGVNLAAENGWSTAWTFVDLFKSASPWVGQIRGQSVPFDTGKAVNTDDKGWPMLLGNEAAGTMIMSGMDGHYPGGRYICRYEGKGEIHFGMDAEVTRESPGVIELFVRPKNGIYMRIDASDRNDPIRNITIKTPEYDVSEDVFHPLFLESLQGFTILRFMDWGRTNDSRVKVWDERVLPDDAMQTGDSGVAYEYMIELCNQLNVNPWLCVPAQADDEYVTSLALLIKDRLKPGLAVYLEYSNEIWNPQFKQSQYCQTQGLRLGLSTDPKTAKLRFQSQRSVAISRLFKSVVSSERRVIHVMSSQTVSPESSRELLSWAGAYQEVDALAIGAYFGHETASKFLNSRLDEWRLIDEMLMDASRSIEVLARHVETHRGIAERFGVTLTAYEAGQHLTLPGNASRQHPLHQVIAEVNGDLRMGELYDALFEMWQEQGGGPLVGFNHVSKPKHSGTWGLLAYQDSMVVLSPKMQAFVRLSNQIQQRSFAELLADTPAD